jgi:hypothetical protein
VVGDGGRAYSAASERGESRCEGILRSDARDIMPEARRASGVTRVVSTLLWGVRLDVGVVDANDSDVAGVDWDSERMRRYVCAGTSPCIDACLLRLEMDVEADMLCISPSPLSDPDMLDDDCLGDADVEALNFAKLSSVSVLGNPRSSDTDIIVAYRILTGVTVRSTCKNN